jgi:hypothetical protein
MVLTAPGGKIPKDLSWNAGKKFMGNVDAFLKSLLNFDKDNIPTNCVDMCEKDFLSNPNFTFEFIKSKSSAAAGLCSWVINICKYFRIYQVGAEGKGALKSSGAVATWKQHCSRQRDGHGDGSSTPQSLPAQVSSSASMWCSQPSTLHVLTLKPSCVTQVVAPKRAALAEANKKLETANKKLTGIRARVKELQDRVAALEAGLMKATEDKNAAIAQAEKTSRKAGLADRLVNGLSGENKRWTETIQKMEVQGNRLVSGVPGALPGVLQQACLSSAQQV